jgi:hypothetical protein
MVNFPTLIKKKNPPNHPNLKTWLLSLACEDTCYFLTLGWSCNFDYVAGAPKIIVHLVIKPLNPSTKEKNLTSIGGKEESISSLEFGI